MRLPSLFRRTLVGNALSLYAVQGLNYLLPLLLVPYLLRVLGVASYGKIVFAQALLGYAAVVTEYGFNLTAARDISIARDDPAAVARIYWSTMAAKLLLLTVSFLVIGALVAAVPTLRDLWAVILCCSTLAAGSVLFPQWYLQGLERLRETAAIQAFAKVITAVGTIAFVHGPGDLLIAGFVLSSQQLAGVAAAALLGKSLAPSSFVRPSTGEVRAALASGWHMFIGGAAVTLYGYTNMFVLGLMAGEKAVAIYSVGYKLISVVQGLASPVVQAIYPRTSALFDKHPAQAWALLTRVARLLMPAMATACALLALFAPAVVEFIAGRDYAAAVPVTRILCLTPTCVTAAMLLAQCVMVNTGLTRSLARIYLAVGLFNLAILPALIYEFSATGAALSLLCAEFLGPLLMLRSIARNRDRFVALRATT